MKTYVDDSTPFEYATKDNKSLYKYNNKYYYTEGSDKNKEYTGEVIIKAKELHKLSNIKSSLGDGNTTSSDTTPAQTTSENGNSAVVIEDLKTIKANKADKAYVDEKVAKLDKKSDLVLSGVSNAVAIANLPQVSGDRKFNLAASYGYYGGSHAVAVGFSGTNDKQNLTYKLSGSVNSKGNLAFGIGASVMMGSVNKSNNFEERLNKLEKENQELKEIIKKLMNK
uniref:YadA C-terminal domain-containing protein n=1 Tax=Sneathia sanguinegens TaxID=40543 RepID=UPI001E33B391